MIYNNPEFKKNIKLEFSATRLLIPAFILALTAWIGWSVGEVKSWENTPLEYEKAQSLTYWMFGFGFIFSIIWGSYLASNSLLGEMRQKTWDFMRMSSLAPEKILFGKLFGATSVVWVITLLGVLPTILIASDHLFIGGGYHRPLIITLASLCGAITFWMVLSYAFVMLAGIYNYSKNDSRHTTIGSVLLVLILGLIVGAAISTNYGEEFKIYDACRGLIGPNGPMPCQIQNPHIIDGIKYALRDIHMVNWYGIEFFPLDTIALGLMFCAFWTVIGLYRTLRSSLQYMDAPYIWPVFWLGAAFYLNGFSYEDNLYTTSILRLTVFFALSIGLTCVKESRNLISYRQLYESLKNKKYKEAYRLTPLWLISLVLFAFTSPLLLISSGNLPSGYNFSLFYLSIILLAVRDIFAIHLISWRQSVRIPTVGIAVYLLLMYVLAPFLFGIIFGKTSGAMSLFMPISVTDDFTAGTTPYIVTYITLHTCITLILFILLRSKLKNIITPKV